MSPAKLFAQAAVAIVLATTSAAAADLKAPDRVRTGLRIMNQVVGHTGRLIDAKNYDQLPREGREFTEGAEALKQAIADEPASLKAKVGPEIDAALKSSAALSDVAKSHDDAKVRTAHAAFAKTVQAVIGDFPQDVRPAAARPAG
jgi:hypothetical protein